MAETHDVVWTPEKVAATWDYFSDVLAGGEVYFSAHAGRRIVESVDRTVGLRGKRVLDFGCGRGDLLRHLFACGIRAQGLEFSEESARATAERFGDDPCFDGVFAGPDAIPGASVDVVFLVEVVEHLLEDQVGPTLVEVRRLLAPGGFVAVTCPNGERLPLETVRCPDCGAVFHHWQHVRSLTPQSIAELFERHGFETVRSEAVNWGATAATTVRRLLRGKAAVATPHLLYIAFSP